MDNSRGAMRFKYLFDLTDITPNPKQPHADQLIQYFLWLGGGPAVRWIQMPKGALLLQIEEQETMGIIYVFEEETRRFYSVTFDDADDATPTDFDHLVMEYRMLDYLENPSLIDPLIESPASF